MYARTRRVAGPHVRREERKIFPKIASGRNITQTSLSDQPVEIKASVGGQMPHLHVVNSICQNFRRAEEFKMDIFLRYVPLF